MLQAVVETADWTSRKIRAIRNQMSHAAEHIRQQAPSIYSRELVDLIFSQPYCRIQNVVDAGLAKRQTASTYLKTLTEAGVLREIKVGRDKIFTHPHLLRLLTAEGNEPLDYN
jgi:Fic family protein